MGRLADARKRPEAAAAAFSACRRLLLSGSGSAASADATMPDAKNQGDDSGAAAVAEDAMVASTAAAATAPSLRLRGCGHDAVISVQALDTRLQVMTKWCTGPFALILSPPAP